MQQPVHHKPNHTGNVAVSTDRYWLFIDEHTPMGQKMNLLNATGAATIGVLTPANIGHFRGWEPLARVKEGMLE